MIFGENRILNRKLCKSYVVCDVRREIFTVHKTGHFCVLSRGRTAPDEQRFGRADRSAAQRELGAVRCDREFIVLWDGHKSPFSQHFYGNGLQGPCKLYTFKPNLRYGNILLFNFDAPGSGDG